MDKKLLICGAGVLLGIAFLFSAAMKVAPRAESAASGITPLKKNQAPVERFNMSRHAARSTGELRPDLLKKLADLAKSADAFDRDRFSTLLARLVEIDPEAAANFVTSLPAGMVREEALRRLSQAWAAKDPAAAEIWTAGLSDESERTSALADVCVQIAQADAGQAIEILQKHGPDATAGSVTENLVQQWAGQDFPSAAAWIKARPAGEKRDQMIMRLALVQSATEPAEAARLVINEIPEGPVQSEAIISVIYQWARRDMGGAREWVGLFPESALRTRAENELSNLAAYQSPAQQ